MSTTLSEPPTSGNAIEARPQPEETVAQIDGVLHNFNVLSSKVEKHIFRYAYLYLFGLLLLYIVFAVVGSVFLGYTKNISNLRSLAGFAGTDFIALVVRASISGVLSVVWISLALWLFNAWREHVPHYLRDVFVHRRSDMPVGDVNTHYLAFLTHYRAALRCPRRYLLIGSALAVSLI